MDAIPKRLGKPQDKIEIEDIPNFVNVSVWWDMNNNDINLEFHAISHKIDCLALKKDVQTPVATTLSKFFTFESKDITRL